MNIARFNGLLGGAMFAAALLAAPVLSSAQTSSAASGPVTCKDGTTSPHGGRGACSGHGGIDKSASAGASTSGSGSEAAPAAAAPAAGAAPPRRLPHPPPVAAPGDLQGRHHLIARRSWRLLRPRWGEQVGHRCQLGQRRERRCPGHGGTGGDRRRVLVRVGQRTL